MNYLELFGTLVGLVYLWLEYRASIYLWLATIVMPAIYIFVYYRAGLYADFGINIYYLLAAVYGWAVWVRGRRKAAVPGQEVEEMPITRMPVRLYAPLGALSLLFLVLIAAVLIRFTDSDVPWADSFTTALSMVALWMLARKYVEQWLVWAVVDAVCCVLYLYKELYFTSALYGLYTVVALLGYRKWKELMSVQPAIE